MASILSYNQIIELLTDISRRHYQLNTFYLGRNWELENSEDITYPLFQVYPDFGKLTNNGYSEYKTQDVRFVCKVIDKTFNGEENEKDIHSDTLRIAQDIVNEFSQHPFYIRSNIKLIGDVDFRPLEEFEDDITAGWEFSLTFRIINLNTFCGMPIEQIPGYSATGPTSDAVIVNVKFLTCETLPDCPTITTIEDTLVDLQYQIDNLPPSGLDCNTIGDCTTIINIQSNIDDINTELDNLPAQKWIDGSTGYQSIKVNNDTGLDATGDYSVAEGAGTLASGFASHSEGSSTIASGLASHAEGNSSQSIGDSSHSEGDYTIASGYISHAEGNTTQAIGDISHAEGNQTLAISEATHTEGYQTIAGAKAYLADSIVNGLITVNSSYGASIPVDTLIWINDGSDDNVFGTIIKQVQSLTFNGTNLLIQTNVFDNSIDTNTCKFTPIGFPNESNADEGTGQASHAEGDTTIAIGDASHAEGYETIAGGDASHAEGNTTIASGNNSHAGGINSIASGSNSFVHGNGSTASGNGTVVLGDGIDGTADNTTYVNQLNISNVPTGTTINNLGIDVNGNVTIASLISIKTVNGNTLLGSGDLQVGTILGTVSSTLGNIPFSSGVSNTVTTGNLNYNSTTQTLSGMNKITINNSVYPNTQLLFGTAVNSPYMMCASPGYQLSTVFSNQLLYYNQAIQLQASLSDAGLWSCKTLNVGSGTPLVNQTANIVGSLAGVGAAIGMTVTNTNTTGVAGINIGETITNRLGVARYGSTSAGGTINGTSIFLQNSSYIFSTATGGVGAGALYFSGLPIIHTTGLTTTNIGTRLDANGLRIGPINTLHTANPTNVQFKVNDIYIQGAVIYGGTGSQTFVGLSNVLAQLGCNQTIHQLSQTSITTRINNTVTRFENVTGTFFGGSTASTALVDISDSNTTRASLRIRAGVAPTTPNDGDIWFDGTDIKMRVGGVTKTFTLI